MSLFTLFFLIVLIFSIIIHEVSHGFMANYLGDPTARLAGRLTLNPISHIDLFGSLILPALLVLTHAPFLFGWAKPVPYNPYNLRNQKWGEALVAGAGPAVNIFLALVFGLFMRFGAGMVSETSLSLVSIIVYTNLLLAVFNLIPVPPLDGSKLLRSFLPLRANMAFVRFEENIMRGGIVVFFLFIWVFVTLISPFLSWLVSWSFLLITGTSF